MVPTACVPAERPRWARCVPTVSDFARPVRGHHYSLGTIGSYMELVLSAPCSGRAAASVLKQFVPLLPGLPETPCANTGRTWLFRLGLYELLCAKEVGDDWVWLADHTVQLGSHKGLIVVGLRSSLWQQSPRPLEHEDVRLLCLEPTEHSGGRTVQMQLEQVVAKTGIPRQVVIDGGPDLKRGVRLFCQSHPGIAQTYDVKHKMALLLKKELEGDGDWDKYVSQANLARRGLTLTSAGFLVPPGLQTKARYMNVDRLVAWGQKIVGYLDHPREVPGSAVDRRLVESRLGWLRGYRRRLVEWSALLAVAQTTEHYVRHQGLHAQSTDQLHAQLEPLAACRRSGRMKDLVLQFVSQQASAARPHERLIGSTEVLESIIGKYKRLQSMHSAGGMTGMILSIGAIVGPKSLDTMPTALQQVSNSDVRQWCREQLGVTLQAQRKRAFPTEQKRPPKQLTRLGSF